MSAFERKPVAKPGPASRKPRQLMRDPDLPKWFVGTLIASVILGAVVWYAASSRGADLLEVQTVIGLVGIVAGIVLAFAALARGVMLQDLRPAVVLVAVILGWAVGGGIANRVVPGNATDGDAALTAPVVAADSAATPAAAAATQGSFGGPVRCDWDPAHAKVLTVTGRRDFPMGDPPPFPASMSLDLGTGTLTVHRFRLDINQLVATYTASFPAAGAAAGGIVLANVTRTVASGLDSDTLLLVDLMDDLNGWTLSWDCPQFP